MRAHYLFGKSKLPQNYGHDLDKVVTKLSKLKTQKEVLNEAYSIIVNRYYGKRLYTQLKFFAVFSNGIDDLWKRRGFMHCSNQNYLLAFLLVKSGAFKTQDIKPKWTLYWGISPHQYLRIKLNDNKFVNVDPWSAAYGIGFGDYAHGFHTGSKAVK
jgi:hypothetical protein